MRKITLFFSLLLAVTAMAESNDAEITPISSLENFQDGWYQIKTGESYSNGAEGKYLSCVGNNGDWMFSLVDDNSDVNTLIYISKNGNNYNIRNLNGNYASANAQISPTPVDITFTVPDTEKPTEIKITSGKNVWAGWFNDNKYFVGISSGEEVADRTKHAHYSRFYLYSAEAFINNNYKIYTVDITGAPNNNTPTVTCNNSSSSQITTVYNGGAFIFSEGTSISSEIFTCSTIDGYDSDITIEGDEIMVTYYSQTPLEDTEKNTIIAEMEKIIDSSESKKVGHLIEIPEEFTQALQTFKTNGTQKNAVLLKRQFDRAWNISNIYLPEDGKIYRLISVLSNGSKRYVYANGNNITWADEPVEDKRAYFVCQNIGGNVKLASLTASGLFSEVHTINEDGTRFFFDVKKAEEIGHIMLIVDSQPKNTGNLAYRAIGTIANGMGYYTNNSDYPNNISSIQSVFNETSSTDFIFEEVPMPTDKSDSSSEDEVANDSEGDGDGKVGSLYDYKVNLTYGHNREDEYSYYGTLYLPFAVTLPQNVKAYMVKPSDDWTILEEVELSLGDENTLPAGTPVLLKGEIGEEETSEATAEGSNVPPKYTFTIAANAGATATVADTEGDNAGSSIEDNGLRGRCSDGDPEDGTAYILALTDAESDREVRFFRLADGQQVNGNKAYYLIPTASGASLATIALSGGNRVTAIENAATTTTDAAAACYDLSGRQVTKPAAGLYIVGGKKVFVK